MIQVITFYISPKPAVIKIKPSNIPYQLPTTCSDVDAAPCKYYYMVLPHKNSITFHQCLALSAQFIIDWRLRDLTLGCIFSSYAEMLGPITYSLKFYICLDFSLR